MIFYFLYLEVQFRSEVVERILRVVRHRGFILHTLHVLPCNYSINNNRYKLHVYMTVIGNRSIGILCENLNKLIDVSYVSVQNNNLR